MWTDAGKLLIVESVKAGEGSVAVILEGPCCEVREGDRLVELGKTVLEVSADNTASVCRVYPQDFDPDRFMVLDRPASAKTSPKGEEKVDTAVPAAGPPSAPLKLPKVPKKKDTKPASSSPASSSKPRGSSSSRKLDADEVADPAAASADPPADPPVIVLDWTSRQGREALAARKFYPPLPPRPAAPSTSLASLNPEFPYDPSNAPPNSALMLFYQVYVARLGQHPGDTGPVRGGWNLLKPDQKAVYKPEWDRLTAEQQAAYEGEFRRRSNLHKGWDLVSLSSRPFCIR